MIIIYNLSGLLIGIAGIAVGFLAIVVTGWISAGLLTLGAIWLAFGRARRDPETGIARPAPALFFIPLYLLSIPILLLALLAAIGDVQQGRKALDPRSALLQADQKALDQTKLTGDPDLAGAAYDALKAIARDDKMHVFAAARGPAVLVLVKIPSLKEIGESDRAAMAQALIAALEDRDASRGRQVYLGIRGRLTYGIIRTPAGTKIGSVVSSDPLLEFYGPPAPGGRPSPAG